MYSTNTWNANSNENKENMQGNSTAWHTHSHNASKHNASNWGAEQNTRGGTLAESNARNNSMMAKHAENEVGFAVDYTDYEQLPAVADTQVSALIEHTRANFASGAWLQAFHAITALRALHKSYAGQVNAIFAAFDAHILTAIDSPRPALNKNILAFVFEVLSHARASALDTRIVSKLADILLRKMGTPSKLLRQMLQRCMRVLADQCLCDETLVKLCELSTAHSAAVSKHALRYVRRSVRALGEKVSELQPFTLQALFVSLGHNLLSRCGKSKECARDMCAHFAGLMRGNYEAYVMMLHAQGTLSDEHARAFARVVRQDAPRLSLAQRMTLAGDQGHVAHLRLSPTLP